MLAILFLAGVAVAGPFSVGNLTESGSGGSTVTSPLLWWHLRFVDRVVLPSPAPLAANGTDPLPQLLPAAGGSFALNTAITGHAGVRFAFNETTGAPPSTEFEIALTVTNVTTGANTSYVAFFETQSRTPTSGLGFTLYLDLGTVSAALAGELYVAQACGAIGSCP
ncbi:MAG TPA: hypothetical protein VFF67_06490 [Thermoplasmata archaeon]|nr:hypothetical protein [Thermoplasmata archaeon]